MPKFVAVAYREIAYEAEIEAEDKNEAEALAMLLDDDNTIWTEIDSRFELELVEETD